MKSLRNLTSCIFFITVVPLLPLRLASAEPSLDPELSVKFQRLIDKVENLTDIVESQQSEIEKLKAQNHARVSITTVAPSNRSPVSSTQVGPSAFNPAMSAVLSGRYSSFSNRNSDIEGFSVGDEGARGSEGFAVNESELDVAASVDDKFFGSLTAALVREDGEDKVGVEEAVVETQPGMGLPIGLNIKAGRALWVFGYLNEHHTHIDDFADRPLPYRVFLNGGFNDDGVQFSYVLPTDVYSEIGGGVYRGDDFPFGSASGGGVNSWSGFARVGGDIGEDQNWRVGGYILSGNTDGRFTDGGAVRFVGDTALYGTDLRYTWAPTGNPRAQEVIVQGEYLWRNEDGVYEDTAAHTGANAFHDNSSGYYAQVVFKFLPQWRIGTRYSALFPPRVPTGLKGSSLDSAGYDPKSYSAMMDWTNSEFSRIRFQFNREELSRGEADNQFIVQYIMSIGAHGAHAY